MEINTNLDTTPLPPNNLVAKDPQSKELAGYVRTKTFGREVREAIARSIELNSTRSKSAEILASETVNVANDLTDRFNQQIGALTEDSEVIDARFSGTGVIYNNLKQRLDAELKSVNYAMFGANGDVKYYNPSDGKYYLDNLFTIEYTHDDGLEILKAHEFANAHGLPVVNKSGHYVILSTRNIPVKTNTDLGDSVFHVKESLTPLTSGQVFSILKSKDTQVITDQSILSAIAPKLITGAAQIEELKPYQNSLIVFVNENKIIKRNGTGTNAYYEDFLYADQDGKIYGSILWKYVELTKMIVYPCDDTYLTFKGGAFKVSGDLIETDGDMTAKVDGIYSNRSRLIIKDQTLSFEDGVEDTSSISSNGFYSLNYGYDVNVSNLKILSRSKPGSYAIACRNLLNFKFDNITGGGDGADFGSIGTNYMHRGTFKNCHVNRIDVHLSAMDIDITNCMIGRQGISLQGGGYLNIDRTSVERFIFLEIRGDYGAHWDGNISIKDSKLISDGLNQEHQIILHHQNGDDFGFPLVFGRNVQIENFEFDYRPYPTQNLSAHLINYRNPSTPTKYLYSNEKISLPTNISFKDIRVIGRDRGVKMFKLRYPHLYKTDRNNFSSVARNNITLRPNAFYSFDSIDVEKIVEAPQSLNSVLYFLNAHSATYEADSLIPKLSIKNLRDLTVLLGSSVLELEINSSVISTLDAFDGGDGRSVLKINQCEIRPEIIADGNNPFQISYNDLQVSNTTIYPTNRNVASAKALVEEVTDGTRLINGKFNGVFLSLDLINYLKTKFGETVTNNTLTKLNNHQVVDANRVFTP